MEGVQIWVVEIPAVGLCYFECEVVGIFSPVFGGFGHGASVGIGQRGFDFESFHRILNRHVYLDVSTGVGDARGLVAHAPLRDVGFGGADYIYVAVYARAGIPARVGVAAVFELHGQHIVAVLEVRRHIVHEGYVAVGAFAEQVAVEVNFAAVICAFKVDIVLVGTFWLGKVLAVPAYSAGQIACGTGKRGRRRCLDAPVVGQVESAPFGVVISRRGSRGVGFEGKAPVIVEFLGLPERYLCLHGGSREGGSGEKQIFVYVHRYVLIQRYILWSSRFWGRRIPCRRY